MRPLVAYYDDDYYSALSNMPLFVDSCLRLNFNSPVFGPVIIGQLLLRFLRISKWVQNLSAIDWVQL